MSAQTEHRLKIALWAIPIIFSCGAFYAVTTASSADVTADVASIKAELDKHEALRAHPVTEERIDTILTEQRAVRAEQREQAENISAICQATGARCK